MKVQTVVTYTESEICSIIDTLTILANIVNDQTATSTMQNKANGAFEDLADLLCLDKEGEKAFQHEGW